MGPYYGAIHIRLHIPLVNQFTFCRDSFLGKGCIESKKPRPKGESAASWLIGKNNNKRNPDLFHPRAGHASAILPAMLPFPHALPHGDSCMKKLKFIPVDLNKLPYVERYPIMNQSTIDTIKEEYGGIYDGLKIWLYSDTFRSRKLDPSVFQGIVRFNEEIGEFEIVALPR